MTDNPFTDEAFGICFKQSSERVGNEQADRREQSRRAMRYHVTFLDEMLRGLLPNDLVLVGAPTGVGKTQLVMHIAAENARQGKQVFMFALEAEDRELERRLKYRHAMQLAREAGCSGAAYVDWYLGNIGDRLKRFDDTAAEIVHEQYRTLHTYYRGSKFDRDDVRKLFTAIQSQADMIVLDHLHYVDIEDDNENRGYKALTKTIRDTALSIGKPVLVVVHLRKRDRGGKSGPVQDLDDVHGSSDITKMATHVVMISPARDRPSADVSRASTYMHVPKDRRAGATGLVALLSYDRELARYNERYGLGRINPSGTWEPLKVAQRPSWASSFMEVA